MSGRRRVAFRYCLAAYAVSFVLPAVAGKWENTGFGMLGLWCAIMTLAAPRDKPLAFLVGLINPLVLAYLFISRSPSREVVWGLRVLILAFLPLSWVVMHALRLGPHVGHVVWIASIVGLLLVPTLPPHPKP